VAESTTTELAATPAKDALAFPVVMKSVPVNTIVDPVLATESTAGMPSDFCSNAQAVSSLASQLISSSPWKTLIAAAAISTGLVSHSTFP